MGRLRCGNVRTRKTRLASHRGGARAIATLLALCSTGAACALEAPNPPPQPAYLERKIYETPKMVQPQAAAQLPDLELPAPGAMPSGARWDGVYYSELYGYLHIAVKGDAASGRWQRPVKDRWGELRGKITGNVLEFSWSEHVNGPQGPGRTRSGKGYFKYERPSGENVDDQLRGEVVGDDESSGPWEAMKQRNIPPDPGSIGDTSTHGTTDWDTK